MWTQRRLPRLPKEFYCGPAHVFWTYAAKDRRTGWLNAKWHARFREVLTHTCSRHALVCPAYVLMPDLLHLVLIGCAPDSDQLKATRLMRQNLPLEWQKQAHDHVLREDERKRGQFNDTCDYIWANPVRSGLVERPEDWAHHGCLVPGYPSLTPMPRERFWRCVERYRER